MAGFNTAITGLKAATTDLDVTGNNIANSSTIGFKSSRTEFGDIYATAVVGAGSSNVAGSGVTVTDIAQDFKAGTTAFTNNNLDLAINGSGFFQLDDGQGSTTYTRAGAFELDKNGFVVSKSGKFLQGYGLDSQGNRLPIGDLAVTQKESPPKATENVALSFNINDAADATKLSFPYDKDTPSSFTYSTTVQSFDSLGNEHTIKYNMVEQRPARNVVTVKLNGPDDTVGFSGLAGIDLDDLNDSTLTATGTVASDLQDLIGNQDPRIDKTTLAYDAGTQTLTFESTSQFTDYGDYVVTDSVVPDVTIGYRDSNEVHAYDISAAAANTTVVIGGVSIPITAGATDLEVATIIFSREAEIKNQNPSVESVTIEREGSAYRIDIRFKAEEGEIQAGEFSVTPGTVMAADAGNTFKGDNSYNGNYRMFAYLNGDELLDIGKVQDPGEIGFTAELSEVGPVMLGFNPASGQLSSVNGTNFASGGTAPAITISGADPANSSTTIALDLTGSTQFASASIVKSSAQDGYTKGDLIGVTFADSGEMVASFSNGQNQNLGVVAFATFENQSGLQPSGDTEWTASLTSGDAILNPPGTGLNGSLRSAALEQSNVDLSEQLVKLIEAQRNFQANSKTLETLNTVTQSILQI
ncbi:MAG: flagellar hook-basal body complex protein [Amphritea sp.]